MPTGFHPQKKNAATCKRIYFSRIVSIPYFNGVISDNSNFLGTSISLHFPSNMDSYLYSFIKGGCFFKFKTVLQVCCIVVS
jgi:hypothetical protein